MRCWRSDRKLAKKFIHVDPGTRSSYMESGKAGRFRKGIISKPVYTHDPFKNPLVDGKEAISWLQFLQIPVSS